MNHATTGDTDPREVYIADRAGWRRWLEAHADSLAGVWLVRDTGPNRRLSYEEVVEEALCFGWVDSKIRHKEIAVLFRDHCQSGLGA